jgi:hypothetical protein
MNNQRDLTVMQSIKLSRGSTMSTARKKTSHQIDSAIFRPEWRREDAGAEDQDTVVTTLFDENTFSLEINQVTEQQLDYLQHCWRLIAREAMIGPSSRLRKTLQMFYTELMFRTTPSRLEYTSRVWVGGFRKTRGRRTLSTATSRGKTLSYTTLQTGQQL